MESRLVYTHKTATQALAVDRIHCNHAVLSNHALLTRTHANGSNCNYCKGPQRVNTLSRAAPIRGRPLLRSALGLCGVYSRAATITLSSGIVWRLFEGGHYYAQLWDCVASIRGWLLLRSALGLCGAYSRAATITLSSGIVRRLFEGGY